MASTHGPEAPSTNAMLNFVLKNGEFRKAGLRLGQLTVQGRPSRATPNFIASTSRGVIPHITQDVMSKLTDIPVVYIGLEDSHSLWLVIERRVPNAPLLKQPAQQHTSKLRNFIGLPGDRICILGPRRNPPVETPNHTTPKEFAICTSVGFQALAPEDYISSAPDLNADITLSLADVVTTKTVSQKRLEKSVSNTETWMNDTFQSRRQWEEENYQDRSNDKPPYAIFASIPPLEPYQQSSYLSDLNDIYKDDVSGLALYHPETASTLPDFLTHHPRICLTNPETPHDILTAIELSNDLISVPFITSMSENGTALSFTFASPSPPQQQTHEPSSLSDLNSDPPSNQPIGINMWLPHHSTSLEPLSPSCPCYTCTTHHAAYIHHLLSAHEMLAWTLLQIHNFHVIDTFFAQIRDAIADGTYEEYARSFRRRYDGVPLVKSGQGPRVRGYQGKSVGGGEPKKNVKAYGRLEEKVGLGVERAVKGEEGVVAPEEGEGKDELERHGLGSAV